MLLYWVRSDITKVIRVIAVPTGDDYKHLPLSYKWSVHRAENARDTVRFSEAAPS